MSAGVHPYEEYELTEAQWLSEIPSHWELFEAKRLFSNRREASHSTDEQLAASQQYGVVPQSLMMAMNDAKVMLALKGTSSFRHVEKDDFVISLRSFEGGIEHSEYSGCVSPAYTVLAAKRKLCSSYFKFLMKCESFVAALQSTTDSLRDGKAISYKDFGSLDLPFPEYTEQKQIAAFLHYKTAKIDALIEKQQQLIALLGEKRQAVVSHAVTKGLNHDVPMRDSGVEWLGEVPEHWGISRLKQITTNPTSGPYGSSLTKAMYTQEGIRVYGQQQVIASDFAIGDYYISTRKFEEMSRYEVFADDILITVMGTIGRVAVVPKDIERGIINPRLVRYKAQGEKILPEFLRLSILGQCSQNWLSLMAQGSTMEGLNMQILGNLFIPFPGLEEQKAIVSEVEAKSIMFADLLDTANDTVDLLRERRSALISAAVTGKIDIRNWKPPTDDKPQKPKKEAA